jgi:dihydroneopterin aldolase
MQQILIHGLTVETLIGVYDWERTQKTALLLDLTIDTDLSNAMVSDKVEDTIHYAFLAEYIQGIGAASSFALLEAFANAVIQGICANYPVTKVDLTVTKPGIIADAEKVAIRICHQVPSE